MIVAVHPFISRFGKTIKVFTVEAHPQLIFWTLDDCFGMDRVSDWCKKHGVTLVMPK